MKSQIHENKKSKLLGLSKKIAMLIAMLIGTSVMVNAEALPVKTAPVKEIKMTKHPKNKKAKAEKKSAVSGTTSSSAKK
jgi:hypothetical protein